MNVLDRDSIKLYNGDHDDEEMIKDNDNDEHEIEDENDDVGSRDEYGDRGYFKDY
jgi:hypothetical protein